MAYKRTITGAQHRYLNNYAYLQMSIGVVEQSYAGNYSIIDIIVKHYFPSGFVTHNISNVTYELRAVADDELTSYFAANGGTGSYTGTILPNAMANTDFESEAGVVFKKRFQINHDENGEAQLNLQFKLLGSFNFGTTTYSSLGTNDTFNLPSMGEIPYITAAYPTVAGNMTDEATLGIYVENKSAVVDKLVAMIAVTDKTGLDEEFEVHRVEIPTTTNGIFYFNVTEDERNSMRYELRNVDIFDYHFYLISTVGTEEIVRKLTRDAHIVNCEPAFANTRVVDANSTTVALTGDANILVYGESMAEYYTDLVLRKGAELAEIVVKNGDKKRDLQYGVFDNVESGVFTFDMTDSRGKVASKTVTKTVLPYVKPTCYIQVEVELVEETAVQAHFFANGSYFRGSFGAVDNAFKIEIRHTQNDGNMGDWTDITPIGAIFDENSYEITTTITGLIYRQNYDFQLRITDSLHTVQSATYTAVLQPVFDWGEQDFNFNVPVNMNGKPVLRHNRDGNHTILSASGGRIHLRPKGSDNEDGQFVIYPDVAPVGGNDYVIETGKEAMGSNGTWYWEKWASGKAVCWGRRNFGKMNLSWVTIDNDVNKFAESDVYTQTLPEDLFVRVPESVHMQIATSNQMTWITAGSVDADSIELQAYAFYPQSYDTSYIGFHVIGRWKADEE